MVLSTHQKFILETLRKLGCTRQRQLHVLVRERFRQADLEITQVRMSAMLRQLRMGTANVQLDDDLVWLHGCQPDYRRLEAVDVMLELTEGRPETFSVSAEPPRLLRFAYARPFSVASLDIAPLESLERGRMERIVWISDSSAVPPIWYQLAARFLRNTQNLI